MRKEDFNNALNYIDYDLVEEYVSEKENAQKRIARIWAGYLWWLDYK